MKKTYLVKKNPNMPESADNWIVMNGFEFARFMETVEGQNRKDNFGRLDACSDNDDIMIIECGKDTAAKWKTDRNEHDYLKQQEIESGLTTISYNSLGIDDEGEELSGDDVIADPDSDFYSEIERKADEENMRKGLDSLTPLQKDIVSCLYLNDIPQSEAEYATTHHIKQQTVHVLKTRALKKIRKYF